ncbi:ATP-binding protein, partial [Undibacterium sp.]|uniref:ATP-binding protein n=1 Tax=Undibacterium sp. TaxID=1914977 RepID=UPI002C006135
EAEMMRPYGIWIDALRPLTSDMPPGFALRDLEPLLPAAAADTGQNIPGDRGRLFSASAALLKHAAARQPLVLILDDLQWLDEGSCALLHYLVRSVEPGMRLLLAGAARQGEIDDNPWAKGLLQSLAREHRLHICQLTPLGQSEVAVLLEQVASAAGVAGTATPDVRQVHRLSGGNPLFVLALAQAENLNGGGDFSWQALTADQVQRLDEGSRELICWAAAMGREFRPEMLSSAMEAAESDLMLRLDRLERRGLLKPGGEGRYDFAHDLIREAVYRSLSPPRRRAIHRQIARVLVAAAADDASLHGELAHHASQAGDLPLAVSACISAAQHCLRVYANAEAGSAVNRGLAILPGLHGAERITAHIDLLGLRIVANVGAKHLPAQADELQKAIDAAEAVGLYAAAAGGWHMLSWVAQQENDLERTRIATLRAERISRTADAVTHCKQLANSGRCLLEVESDMAQARALIAAAAEQADAMNMRLIELDWGHALIARWDGRLDSARDSLRTAIELARAHEDRWREFECMVWLATVELERGCFDGVVALCHEIDEVADRMGDVRVPVSIALRELAQLRQAPAGTEPVTAALRAGLDELRTLDDKAHLAYVLNQVATLLLEQGRLDQAQAAAAEALAAAQAVGRATELIVAQALLACIAADSGTGRLPAWLDNGNGPLSNRISARARSFVQRVPAALPRIAQAKIQNRKIPTAIPTKPE